MSRLGKLFLVNTYTNNYALYIVKFSLDLISCSLPIFVDFQNEAAGLCVKNSMNTDVK